MAEVPPLSLSAHLRGQVLAGRYQLNRLVASGGMAHVWEATDTVLGRRVAVKILHEHLTADPQFVSRFRQEAVAAAKVSHPAIVAMYDTISAGPATHDELVALVMQYVPGQTLRQRLDEQPSLGLDEIVPIVAVVAEALEAAHRQGVVHRDIKPANLLLGTDGQVMVADFGIAKAADSVDLTATGTLLGTARYLAPEQVAGDRADARSDIYALSAVLYEALAGRPPFDGPNELAVALARLQRDPVPLDRLRPDLPAAVVATVARGLARRPEDRYASADDFRLALTAAVRTVEGDQPTIVLHTERAAPTFRETERTWLVPTVLLLVVAVALAVAGVLLGQTATGSRLYDRVRGVVGADQPAAPTTVPGGALLPRQSPIVAATSFDPFGTGSPPSEHEELVGFLHDGDPDTTWTTESYSTPAFGNLKPGVGAVVTVADDVPVGALVLRTPSRGWDVEVYAADTMADDLAGWGDAVGRAEDVDGATTITVGAPSVRHLLIWITSLDPAVAPHRVEIGEIEVQ